MTPKYPNRIKHNVAVNRLARWYLNARNLRLEKVIFSATTGRSGTMSLTSLFSKVPGCRALHEPYPIMNGPWLRAASYGHTDDVRRYYERVKAINIRRAAIGARYYLEVNHQFIKTFIEHAVRDFGDRVEVIHLVRPVVEVARSIYYLQHWPGTTAGNHWWLDYRAPSNLIQLPDLLDGKGEFSHPFYKALWYWYETEARVRFWQEKLPDVRFHHFETHWINDRQRIFTLLDDLKIEYDRDQLLFTGGVRENTKEQKEQKEQRVPKGHVRAQESTQPMIERSLDQDVTQQMNERFRTVLTNRGLWRETPVPALSPHHS
ncbi:MAG: hypothetical protein ACREUL_10020 [Steroidobacteraceae bacterium]